MQISALSSCKDSLEGMPRAGAVTPLQRTFSSVDTYLHSQSSLCTLTHSLKGEAIVHESLYTSLGNILSSSRSVIIPPYRPIS